VVLDVMSIDSRQRVHDIVIKCLGHNVSKDKRDISKVRISGEKCQPSRLKFESTDLCQYERWFDDFLQVLLAHQILS
jgi:hypothetical protein